MPIRRCLRWLYPIDWRELSASIRFRRAESRCESRSRPHGRASPRRAMVGADARRWRDGAGRVVRFRLLPSWETQGPPGFTTRVFLATAHLDHDPYNDVPENLAALRQRCHILHDEAEHLSRRRTYLARRALGDPFTGPYPTG